MNGKKDGADDKDRVKAAVYLPNLESKAGWNGSLNQKENPTGQSYSIFLHTKEAHDELYKFITEEKDKLGGDDSVLLLPGLLTLAEIHIIECSILSIQLATRRLKNISMQLIGASSKAMIRHSLKRRKNVDKPLHLSIPFLT